MKLRKLNPLRFISFTWWMSIVFYFVVLMIGGCAEYRPYANQYRPGDPCIKCGERFEQIPNFEYSAVKRKERGEVW